jgi:leucyl aminopeptidase (aminopeptidase T)
MTDLTAAVQTTLSRCLAVAPGENVLIVVDETTERIGQALREGARGLGADAVLAVMDSRAENGTEPPPQVAAALSACDVFIAPTSRSLSHTAARKAATDSGARGATMPGATEDMLARVLAGDIDTMIARSRALAALIDTADSAHVSCPRGTDLTLDLTDRAGQADDGVLDTPGAFGNLPAGEGFAAPLSGEGTVVASSLAGLGLTDPPARLTVRDGRLADAVDGLGPQLLQALRAHGDAGVNLAELGVGTNDAATLTGAMLEDEKILGTIHVAFGASAGIGGTIAVPIHLDVVVLDASLQVGGTPVLDAGRWVL